MNEPIAIANAVIIALTGIVSYLAFRSPGLIGKLLFSSYDILRTGQYYRMLSSGFIHADMGHLLFNMFSLYSFGSLIEWYFGIGFYITIYFVSMLGGNLVSLYLHRNQEYHALGASGGVCGIIFSSIFLLPGGSVYIFFIPIPVPAWLFAVIFVIVSSYGTRRQLGNIGHDAHLGGALAGLFATTLLQPSIVTQSPVLYVSIIVLTAALMVYFRRNPAIGPLAQRHPPPDAGTKEIDREFLEQLRQKIAFKGFGSLTESEKQWLRDIARNEPE